MLEKLTKLTEFLFDKYGFGNRSDEATIILNNFLRDKIAQSFIGISGDRSVKAVSDGDFIDSVIVMGFKINLVKDYGQPLNEETIKFFELLTEGFD